MRIILIIICTSFIVSCINENKKNTSSLTIFAAAGTRLATVALCDSFCKGKEITIEKNFASSGTLARQIYNGAKADIFISANKDWIDYLIDNDIVDKNSIEHVASNSLVIITHNKSGLTSTDLDNLLLKNVPTEQLIAIGDPSYVPVGKYTKKALESLGCYSQLKNNLILSKDVSSVLKYVELGECDWGVVYYTEALLSDHVKIIKELPDSLHKPIRFYMGNLNASYKLANDFSKATIGSLGKTVFKNYGFNLSLNN